MTIEEFRVSDGSGFSGALLALWWDARGDWNRAHEVAQEYDQAAAFYQRALEERPNANWIYRNLASSLSGAGRNEEARQAFTEMMRSYPDLTVAKFRQAMVFSDAALDRMAVNLRKLGLRD